MTIQALFAVDKFGGMGLNGTLPWPHNKEDLAHFKKLTMGHIVVMGRNSWDDPKLPKPLVGREVYVVTKRPCEHNNVISGSVPKALLELEKANPNKIVWVVGGPALLEQCGSVLDKMYITHYKNAYKTDTKLDLKKFLQGWSLHTGSAGPDTTCAFTTYLPLFKRTTEI